MPAITKIHLPHIFSAFAVPLENKKNRFSMGKMYLCDFCNQTFSVNWHIRANPYSPWICRGRFVICPYCGHQHEKNICYTSYKQYVPYHMDLKLTVCKTKATLQADYHAFCFADHNFTLDDYRARECFHFDTDTFKSIYEKLIWQDDKTLNYASTALNTDNAEKVLKHSALCYLNQRSFAYKNAAVQNIFRTLQTALETMLRKKHGKVPSLWVNTHGLPDGILVKSLISFARRIQDTTALNLTRHSSFQKAAPLQFTKAPAYFTSKQIKIFTSAILSQKDPITAAIQAFNLPNKAAIREIIKNEIMDGSILKKILAIFSNYDIALRIYHVYKDIPNFHYDNNCENFLSPIRILHNFYTEKTLAAFFEDRLQTHHISDALMLFRQYQKDIFNTLSERKISIRELHKSFIRKENRRIEMQRIEHRQNHQHIEALEQKKYEELIARHMNKDLNLPAFAPKLTMQVDGYSFSFPRKSLELLIAGKALYNCIGYGGYEEKIQENKSHLVFVKNAADEIVAALEISNYRIVQAEHFHHEPLYREPSLNQAVVNWCKHTGVYIRTQAICA